MRLHFAALMIAVMLIAFPGESEAKRFGSRSVSSSPTVSHHVAHATARAVNGGNDTAGAKETDQANALGTGSPGAAPSLSPEAARRRAEKQEEEERLAKLADEQRKSAKEREKAEKERKAAVEREQQERAQKAEAMQLARLEAEQERARKQWERERLCVIQPVMTDAEIALCKEVWR